MDGRRPTLLRGDIAYGNEGMMAGCAQHSFAYLFKLRQSQRVGDFLGNLARQGNKAGWSPADKGWEGVSQQVQLQGWSTARRVVVSRRKLLSNVVIEQTEQPLLSGITLEHHGGDLYEHAALVTKCLEADLLAVAQM